MLDKEESPHNLPLFTWEINLIPISYHTRKQFKVDCVPVCNRLNQLINQALEEI